MNEDLYNTLDDSHLALQRFCWDGKAYGERAWLCTLIRIEKKIFMPLGISAKGVSGPVQNTAPPPPPSDHPRSSQRPLSAKSTELFKLTKV